MDEKKREEIARQIRYIMISADVNKDGKISQEELKAFLDEKCAFYNDAFDDLETAKRGAEPRNISDIEQLDD